MREFLGRGRRWWIRPCSRFAYSRKPITSALSLHGAESGNRSLISTSKPRWATHVCVARNRQSYYTRETGNGRGDQGGLWEKSTRSRGVLPPGKRVSGSRESKRISASSSRLPLVLVVDVVCHGWLGRMTAAHAACRVCVCVCVCAAHTRVPEGRAGRTEEDDDDDDEGEEERRRKRRRRRRARDTAPFITGEACRG